ncbi:hypothetical protein [Paraglaciecola sp.]|uniref:hypothetical protein n=1 Tax=Paraglaciecola sp. TaxID=1920173 RepID=UPI0030F3C4C9
MSNQTIYWAHFNAEQEWQDASFAKLPAVLFSKNTLPIALLDEVYRPDGNSGIALTLVPQDPVLTEFHQSLGLNFHRESVFESIEQWLSAGQPNWPDLFSRSDTVITEGVKYSLKLLSCSPQKPYSVIPGALQEKFSSNKTANLSTIININSKSFITELCQQAGIPCEGIVVRNAQQLNAALNQQKFPFIIKEPFGVSGKGSIIIKDSSSLQQVERYLLKQIDKGQKLDILVQPWFEKELDFSSQWIIDEQGKQHLLGLSLIKNKGLKFIGVTALPAEIESLVKDSQYFFYIKKLLNCIHQQGYVGPLGIDSMLLVDGSIYPIVEVNARETMGSIAQRWFNALGKAQSLTLAQWDITYHQPINFKLLLAELKQQNCLFDKRDYSGILPLATTSMQLPFNNGQQKKGRWYQIHSSRYDRSDLARQLDIALNKQGASLL